jgi:hypothetical protein
VGTLTLAMAAIAFAGGHTMRPFSLIALRTAALLSGSAVIAAVVAAHPATARDVQSLLRSFGLTTCNSPNPCSEIQNTGTGPAMKLDGTGGQGLYASAQARAGIVSLSMSGEGLTASSQVNHGIQGTTNNPSASNGTSRFGVYGYDGSTDRGNLNVGVEGNSKRGIGVQGQSTSEFGVVGETGNPGGFFGSSAGVEGIAANLAGIGVLGDSSTGSGVYGVNTHGPAPGFYAAGVQGVGLSGSDGVYAFSQGNTGFGVSAISDFVALYASNVIGDANPAAQVVGGSTDPATNSLVTYDSAPNPTFWVDNGGNAHVRGLIYTSGSCSTGCVKTGNTPARLVQRYTPQEAAPTIEDVGEAQLSNGSAYVRIDPAFANVMDRTATYLVFVTPQGLTRGLYVSNKTSQGFAVLEQPGGHASVAFDYRIVAKPFGSSAPRLPMLTSAQLPKAPHPHVGARRP